MEKVKVSKEVFEAIKELEEIGKYLQECVFFAKVMDDHLNKKFKGNLSVLNKLNTMEIMKIFTIGYKKEMSPIEIIELKYRSYHDNHICEEGDGYIDAIHDLIRAGFKIEGINK